MNSEEIQKVLDVSIPVSFFSAVLAADQLKTVKSEPFALVANNQPSTEPGMHWLAIYKAKGSKEIEFFDSCAMPLEFYGYKFMSFLNSRANNIRMNCFRIQPVKSNSCGQFCLYYLIHRIRGFSFEQIIHSFDEFDLELNDKIVREFVIDKFGMLLNKQALQDNQTTLLSSFAVQCCETLDFLLQLNY